MGTLPLILLLAGPADAAPALVTAVSGAVSMDQECPPLPFLVPEGTVLTLAEDASAVVLIGGQAHRVEGPQQVDPQSLARSERATTQAVDPLLSRRVDLSRVGGSRGDGSTPILRPIPGTATLELDRLAWTCTTEPCPTVTVEIVPLMGGAPAWEGQGAGSASLGELELSPGPWAVRLEGLEHGFLVPADAELAPLIAAGDQAAATLPEEDLVGRISVQAAVRWQAGLPTDALQVIDRALDAHPADEALLSLRDALEAQAGLKR